MTHIVRLNGNIIANCSCYDEQIAVEVAIEHTFEQLHIRYTFDSVWVGTDVYAVYCTIQED